MPIRGKGPAHERDLVEFVKSDSNDSNYEDHAPRSARKQRSRAKETPIRRVKPRRRRGYHSDDVVGDSESVASEESFTDEHDADPVELNPNTGRPQRRSTKGTQGRYAESDVDEISDDEGDEEIEQVDVSESEDELQKISPHRTRRQKLLITLKLPSDTLRDLSLDSPKMGRNLRSRSIGHRATSEARTTRRSARLSQEPEGFVELTNSGHARPVSSKAPAKTSGKAPAKTTSIKQPSVILEDSQEDSVVVNRTDEGEPDDTADPLLDSIEEAHVENSQGDPEVEEHSDGDESDEGPVRRTRSTLKAQASKKSSQTRSQSRSQKNKRSGSEDDYNPGEEGSGEEGEAPETSASKRKRSASASEVGEEDSEASDGIDNDELRAELTELERPKRLKRPRYTHHHTDTEIQFDQPSRARRARPSNINYNLLPEEILRADEQSDDGRPAARPPPRNYGRGPPRGLFNIAGPFGGNRALPFGPDARPAPLIGDDSSDDEAPVKPPGALPGLTPMTPHTAQPQNLGRVTKKDMADVTPLEVPPEIGFDSVGGLDDHINKLKEMVMLPLLYPELYSKWKIPPPRGVLFHGPPGTGKTLLARALASSVSSGNRKVTFYMRKGADVMSKWVGEAERQLRLLFEEAKKNQPAIIFFDEFDGLAPVRSSKQEQIHASIVTTLLALMDGMDSRGQIVVIGATNRPDSIDPAFRRPGRFDREFYFPLPKLQGRRDIINIHTRGWEPTLEPKLKNDLAEMTKGYGGSDLRALCTEAVINAVQRTYPQIYKSDKKLQVDTASIKVIAKDFLLAMRKMVPSSERQTGAVADPLPKKVEPLLRDTFKEVATRLDRIVPVRRKILTALEEAEYEDPEDPAGFEHEEILRAFERGRIFRPRLLIKGVRGMGQKYLAGAILHKLEDFYVRTLDLSTLYSDPASPPEAVLSSAFKEARTHQPSILFIPQVNSWYQTVGAHILEQFSSLLRTLSANDAVLLLGIMETGSDDEEPDPNMMRDLFGFSTKHEYHIQAPNEESRLEFFGPLMSYVRKRPDEFPERDNRKKRKIPDLPLAIEEPKVKAPPTKEELKVQYKADRSTLNLLRMVLNPVMREVRDKWRGFNKSAIPDRDIEYLLQQEDPTFLTSDLTDTQRQEQQLLRPFEVATDKHENRGLKETATGRFFYNCNTQIVEQRLSNGYYKRPKEFLFDLKTIAKDHAAIGVHDKAVKANDMYLYAMAEIELIELSNPTLSTQCEAVFVREQERRKLLDSRSSTNMPPPAPDSTVPSGPIQLGEAVKIRPDLPPPITPRRPSGDHDTDMINHTNGTTVPSRPSQESPDGMEIDDSSGSRPQFPAGFTMTPSNLTTTQHESQQTGPIQKLAVGSQLADLQNSASTTTSGHKTSDRTSRGSDLRLHQASQATNGESTQPNSHPEREFFPTFDLPPVETGSQYPDTQSTVSKRAAVNTATSTPLQYAPGSSNGASQDVDGVFKQPDLPARVNHTSTAGAGGLATAPATSQITTGGATDTSSNSSAATHSASIADILNPTPTSPPQPFFLDEAKLTELHRRMARETEGLTVEQLEMIDARCMDVIWMSRANWDRTSILKQVREAMDEVLEDVQWQAQLWTASGAEML